MRKLTPNRPRVPPSSHQGRGILIISLQKFPPKLKEADFKGAVRLACSEDSFADFSDTTYAALASKHPAPPPDSAIPPAALPTSITTFIVFVDEIVQAIRTFPCGSAGGLDGLRSQHLKDMIGPGSGAGAKSLLPTLVAFVSLVLNGECPKSISLFFFGANLTALRKKNGGIRPIAVREVR